MKRLRKSISSDIDIKPVPSPYHGAYRSFKDCLSRVLSDEVLFIFSN